MVGLTTEMKRIQDKYKADAKALLDEIMKAEESIKKEDDKFKRISLDLTSYETVIDFLHLTQQKYDELKLLYKTRYNEMLLDTDWETVLHPNKVTEANKKAYIENKLVKLQKLIDKEKADLDYYKKQITLNEFGITVNTHRLEYELYSPVEVDESVPDVLHKF